MTNLCTLLFKAIAWYPGVTLSWLSSSNSNARVWVYLPIYVSVQPMFYRCMALILVLMWMNGVFFLEQPTSSLLETFSHCFFALASYTSKFETLGQTVKSGQTVKFAQTVKFGQTVKSRSPYSLYKKQLAITEGCLIDRFFKVVGTSSRQATAQHVSRATKRLLFYGMLGSLVPKAYYCLVECVSQTCLMLAQLNLRMRFWMLLGFVFDFVRACGALLVGRLWVAGLYRKFTPARREQSKRLA